MAHAGVSGRRRARHEQAARKRGEENNTVYRLCRTIFIAHHAIIVARTQQARARGATYAWILTPHH